MKNWVYSALLGLGFSMPICASGNAPQAWSSPQVAKSLQTQVLYLPISDPAVKGIPIQHTEEELVDLLVVNNPRIRPLANFSPQYRNTYEGYSKVRLGVYKRLLKMLEVLPQDVGIAYFEGFRPLYKQKEYFDKKFKEIWQDVKDKELAYQETCKHISPFIDNIPTHTTGAAIDMTLFVVKGDAAELLDMGKFDVIFGPNDQQETFSANTTEGQRKNRLLLLQAACQAGLANYGFEWWHYSYGDKMWAYVTQQKSALYGLAVPKNDPILSMSKEAYLGSF